ncbi:MAG: hypothetical protein WCR52_15990, partial [Bacteroidota bacterium]
REAMERTLPALNPSNFFKSEFPKTDKGAVMERTLPALKNKKIKVLELFHKQHCSQSGKISFTVNPSSKHVTSLMPTGLNPFDFRGI